ncbi:MAG: hypothetical protein F4Z04_11900 [Acidobacteria bacterium]|nr:hypothetical protein [Acidobacteriota bacterium]
MTRMTRPLGARRRLALGGALLGWLTLGLAAGGFAADQPLPDAAQRADWSVVRTLIEDGADVDARQGDGATALHWAAYWDELEVATLLMRSGAEVNAANDLGVTPLWAAAENGSAPMAQRLLDAGADPNVSLLSGETPLMTAARVGAADVARALLEAGAETSMTAGRSQTALMWAVAQRHPTVVGVLLEHGAPVDARTDVWTEVVKTTPEPWNPEYVAELPQGGYTPLLFAARAGDLASAKLLVAAGADVDDQPPYGTSATVVAAHSGHRDVAVYLLEQGADPNAADAGYTALHAAILHKDAGLVRALLDHGADANSPVRTSTPVRRDSVDFYFHPSWTGATPFWLAARFNTPDIMRLLLDHGADPLAVHHPKYWPGSLSVRDERVQVEEGSTTAVMAAAGLGGRNPLISVDRMDRIAESAPVRSTRREPDRDVVERTMLEAVTFAAEQGIDVNVANADGNTALHAAAGTGYDSVVEYLVAQGARTDLENAEGRTPLALAQRGALRGRGDGPHESTVELLRRLGAGE